MLYPAPIVTLNISRSDIIRTETFGRCIWNEGSKDVMTYKQQQLLEFVSRQLYTKTATPSPERDPQPLSKNVELRSIDFRTTKWTLTTRNGPLGRVDDMLFVCPDIHDREKNSAHSHQVSFVNGMIYFPCRGGPTMALERLRDMLLCLHDKEEDVASKPVSFPLTLCDSCSEKAVVLDIDERGHGSLLCQPIVATIPTSTSKLTCKHQQAGPIHLFSITFKSAVWLERDVLCSRGEQRAETLSGRIVNALKAY
jgi:hypothetical protein